MEEAPQVVKAWKVEAPQVVEALQVAEAPQVVDAPKLKKHLKWYMNLK